MIKTNMSTIVHRMSLSVAGMPSAGCPCLKACRYILPLSLRLPFSPILPACYVLSLSNLQIVRERICPSEVGKQRHCHRDLKQKSNLYSRSI